MTKQRKEELPEGVIRFRGKLFARITYYDENNKRMQRWKQAKDITEAKRARRKLLNELEDHGTRTVDATRMTFEQLAKHFESNYLVEAEYATRIDKDGKEVRRKIRGLRSVDTPKSQLVTLRDFFKSRRLRSITHAEVVRFRAQRLQAPTRGDLMRYKQELLNENVDAQVVCTRAIASVNRELALLRRMFNVAKQYGWIIKSPFEMGQSLISAADEIQRERILTREEEERLFDACGERTIVYTRNDRQIKAHDAGGKQRERLRSLIIMALNTGCRLGEMLKLRWRDVDFEKHQIKLQAFNTKTEKERDVPISERLQEELQRLWESSKKNSDDLVFGSTNSVTKSFTSARKRAGLDNVRFHDLRHTAATRLVKNKKMSLPEVGRILGHTQANTTYRYTNADTETVRRAGAAFDAFNNETVEPTTELIN